jgi:hypothetical protein
MSVNVNLLYKFLHLVVELVNSGTGQQLVTSVLAALAQIGRADHTGNVDNSTVQHRRNMFYILHESEKYPLNAMAPTTALLCMQARTEHVSEAMETAAPTPPITQSSLCSA